MEILRRGIRDIDFTLIGVVVWLTVFGCVAIAAATRSHANPLMPSHAWLKQLIFAAVGFVLMAAAALFDYRTLRKVKWWLYGITTVLLVAVFGFRAVNGAHSWIDLGPISFQPSEFAKITLIIVVASYMADIDEQEFPDYSLKKSLPIWGMFLPPFLLTLKEPALGQALVMFAIVMTMLAVFVKRSHFIVLTTLLIGFVAAIVVIALRFDKQAVTFVQKVLIGHHLLQEYQANRILTWLDPSYSQNYLGYNVHQAEVAIGSGEVFGRGLFNGTITGGGWVPNQWTDYIFSAIGEELGFVGGSVLIVLFIMLVHRLVRIAGWSSDTFGTYLVMGFVGMFAFQAFENIGMDMYMSPSTGITLPFISYGGTSVVANYIAVGLALSVALRRRKLRFN